MIKFATIIAIVASTLVPHTAFASTRGTVVAQTTVNCYPETYWCYDQFGNRRLCVRRVCDG